MLEAFMPLAVYCIFYDSLS